MEGREGWDIFPFINLAVPLSSRLNNFRYFMLHGKSADLIAFDDAYRIVLEQRGRGEEMEVGDDSSASN